MSEPIGTRIGGSTGPVHSGTGDQHNYHFTIDTSLGDTGGHTPRRIAEDQLRWLRQRFVDPPGMGRARRLLSDTGTAILDAHPGSGRTAAARVLLHELHRDTGIFRELRPDEEEEPDLKDPGLVGAGDRLILDLADASVARWKQTTADLPALRQSVREQQAHLVVVMPHEQEGTLAPDLRAYFARIEPPPGEEVFRRHLLLHRVPPEQYLQPEPVLMEFLHGQPSMEEIAGFADRVQQAHAEHRAGDFSSWCKQARDARKEWRKEVADIVSSRREAPQRALMFVTAMFHGAHADVIHHSAGLLLRTLKTPPDDTPLLACKDLAQRLKEVSAAAGPDGHVRFDKPDYDSAVRAHFWDHMPDLRKRVGDWAAGSMEWPDPHVTPDLREALVGRLADQYLRTERWQELASLAETWSARTASRVRVEAAVHALTHGLEHRRYAGSFRHLVYNWCAYRRLTAELAYVLIRVCTDTIAPTHPDQALVRLHYLARRERGSRAAQDALYGLVSTSGRLRRRMLDRLTKPSSPAADTHLFLQICDPLSLSDPGNAPRALVDEKGVRDCVIAGWEAVLNGLPQSSWQQSATRWLHASATVGRHGGLLLDLLVNAAGQDGRKLAALYSVARAAEPTTPGGRARGVATTELLLRKISAAQGLRPPAAPPRPE